MSLLGKKLLSLGNPSEKRPRPAKEQKPFSEARSLGVLFTWEGKQKESSIKNFIDRINQGRSIKCLCFNPNKKEVINSELPVFTTGELSILGKIESEQTNDFLAEPFDYLFHLDFELNDITRALLMRSKAHFRLGFHSDEGEKFYEMMIGINKSAGLDNFAGQMLKYVNALK